MTRDRLAGLAVCCLLTAASAGWPVVARAAQAGDAGLWSADAPLFRVFLTDGTSLVSYGEMARLDDRVVFSMPTAASTELPQLHLMDISSARVDWVRTLNYAESARAARYIATRAEPEYAVLTAQIAQVLNDVTLATDPRERLSLVERARKTLADWPAAHYRYKDDEIRQMVAMLDEAIADLRAASGAERFDLTLFATTGETPKFTEPLLPGPSAQEVIEQTLLAAKLTESPVERTSLLAAAMVALDRHRAELSTEWAAAVAAATSAAIARELEIDKAYDALSAEMIALATSRARVADVRGVVRILDDIESRDQKMGATRPGTVNAIVAAVEFQLDAARRLRLARDRWAIRLPELRRYRTSISASLRRLTEIRPALEDIKALTGSGPDALGLIFSRAAEILKVATALVPPDELQGVHGMLLSATQLADSAAQIRRQAALTGSMARAWDASSAAAGALMLAARVQTELQTAFTIPQLPQ